MARVWTFPLPMNLFFGAPDDELETGDGAMELVNHLGRKAWAADDTAEEAIITPGLVFPYEYAGGTVKAGVLFAMDTDNTNDIALEFFVEALTSGTDTLVLETSQSWGSANAGTMSLSGSTAGALLLLTITISNKDSVALSDYVRFGIRRDCDSANDDASNDLFIHAAEIYEES